MTAQRRRPAPPDAAGGRAGSVRCSAPPVVPAICVGLSAITAVALLALAFSLGGPLVRPPAVATTTQAALVRRFYAAVNDALAGGNGRAVAELVAPNVRAHVAARPVTGPAAMTQQLAALRLAAPGLRLHLVALTIDGDRVVADVERLGPVAPLPGVRFQRPPTPQPGVERLRLADGRIAEYWSSLADAAFSRALPPATLMLARGERQAGLVRFTLPPRAALADLDAPGPHLLLAETGATTVVVAGSARLSRADAVAAGWQPLPGPDELVLRPGDALLIPAGVAHAVRNDAMTGASLLGVLVVTSVDLAGPARPPSTAAWRPPAWRTIYGDQFLHQPVEWNGRVTITLLAHGLAATRPEPPRRCGSRGSSSIRARRSRRTRWPGWRCWRSRLAQSSLTGCRERPRPTRRRGVSAASPCAGPLASPPSRGC